MVPRRAQPWRGGGKTCQPHGSGFRDSGSVRTGSWMGPPQGKRAPRVGPISIVILTRERSIRDWVQRHGSNGFHRFRVSDFGVTSHRGRGSRRRGRQFLVAAKKRGTTCIGRFDFGFRVSGFGFRVSGSGFRMSEFRFRVSNFGFRDTDFGFRISGFEFRISGFEFLVSGFWVQISGFGFEGYVSSWAPANVRTGFLPWSCLGRVVCFRV